MPKTKKPKSGPFFHCHHNILVEYCWNYQERVDYIKKEKPQNEQEIRLKLFKILPKEAEKDIKDYLEVDQKRRKAEQKWWETYQKWGEAYQKWGEAEQEWRGEVYQKWAQEDRDKFHKWREAEQKWREVEQKWAQEDKDKFHKKWCGCEYWDGKGLVFDKKLYAET